MALVVCVLASGLWLVVLVSLDDRRARSAVRRFTRTLVQLSGCHVTLSGAEHLSSAPAAVLIANHASFADSVVLTAMLPVDFRFVVNHRAAKYPLIGLAIRRSGHLIVNRYSLASRADCSHRMQTTLAANESLLIFPEGTAKSSMAMTRLRNGAFRAAVRTGRPVVPIAIHGTRRILPRAIALLRRGDIHIAVLPPIAGPDALRLRQDAGRAIAAALSAELSHLTRIDG
jgi:1-acyl-sn-glycerol-3-phosphate acyltransferase